MPTSGCGLVYFAVCFDSANLRHHYISSVPQHAISIAGRSETPDLPYELVHQSAKKPIFALYEVFPPLPVYVSGNIKTLALLKRECKIKSFVRVSEHYLVMHFDRKKDLYGFQCVAYLTD